MTIISHHFFIAGSASNTSHAFDIINTANVDELRPTVSSEWVGNRTYLSQYNNIGKWLNIEIKNQNNRTISYHYIVNIINPSKPPPPLPLFAKKF